MYIVVNSSDMLNESLKVITDHIFDKANVVLCKSFVDKLTKKILNPHMCSFHKRGVSHC